MIDNLDNVALELANKALATHFDPEAYIVKYIAESRINTKEDLVPDSAIDEFIKHLLNLFVTYSNDKTSENLMNLLATLRQVMSELYHTCEKKEQRELIKQSIIASQKIYG